MVQLGYRRNPAGKTKEKVKIKTVVEQADGNYTFEAVLTPEQHAFLLEFAVRELIRAGLVPFANTESNEIQQQITVVAPLTDVKH